MIGQWITWLSCFLVSVALLFAIAGGVYWLNNPEEVVCSNPVAKESRLPKGSFEFSDKDYENVGELILSLEQSPPTLQVPDLRQQLIYYGKNGRPDAKTKNTLLHFSINGDKTVSSIEPGQKLYLLYDRKGSLGRYCFSPDNEKTSLWFEVQPVDNDAEIHVTLENDQGELITEPGHLAEFRLNEKEFVRVGGTVWEIGSFRVDGTLLARQKARWYGVDRFLEKHGGEEYQHAIGKHRVDFGENESVYSVFVNVGDCLIWNGEYWKNVEAGEGSQEYPLLLAKKIDDRLITFELWDVEGKGKVLLNLLKSTESWNMQNPQSLQHMFKFLGARTRTKCVFEINRERVTLRPSDWLLLTSKGWSKLGTEEEIDGYVKRKTTGTLFVFEGMTRKDERQVMVGTLYSPARHESQTVEISLQANASKSTSTRESKEVKELKGAKEGEQQNANTSAPRRTDVDPSNLKSLSSSKAPKK
jgi:hypothetical protein